MSALDKFKDMAKTLMNDRLREHKQKGGKVIGTFCSYAPEELVIAAGMVPFRMRAVGSKKTTLGDAWFASTNCSYVRHLFDLALDQKFEFLDGLVFINACDHVRRTYDNWRRGAGKPSFIHMTAVPHKKSGDALKWFYDELGLLRKALEEHFQVSIRKTGALVLDDGPGRMMTVMEPVVGNDTHAFGLEHVCHDGRTREYIHRGLHLLRGVPPYPIHQFLLRAYVLVSTVL